jgi:hypothetical protein
VTINNSVISKRKPAVTGGVWGHHACSPPAAAPGKARPLVSLQIVGIAYAGFGTAPRELVLPSKVRPPKIRIR